jgi:hypothetical protein
MPLDQCHNAGTCNPSNGVCSNPNKNNGAVCNDGNGCTQTDTCQNGACQGTNPVTCTALDQCHNPGTCNPANGTCSNPNKNNGTPCNDATYCTQTDTCQSGSCVGTGNPCSVPACVAHNQCNTGGCNESGMNCNGNMGAGVPCDDGGMPGCSDANTTCNGSGACN